MNNIEKSLNSLMLCHPPPPSPQEPREVSQGGPIRTNSPKTGK